MKIKILSLIVCIQVVCLILSTRTRNKVLNKHNLKQKLKHQQKQKKLNSEEQQKANEMINLLSSYLGQSSGPVVTVSEAKAQAQAANGGAQVGAQGVTSSKKDPRFDDKSGLFSVMTKVGNEKPTKSQVIMEDLDNLPGDYKELEMTKDCELKQGYLGLVTEIDNSYGANLPILTARAVFTVLNKKSISFFNKENINSLVKTVDIVHLKPSYYPTTWEGLFCWQLVPANNLFLIQNQVQKGVAALSEEQVSVSLCAPTQAKMDEWTLAIMKFHNCMVEVQKPEDMQPAEESEVDQLTGWYKTLKTRQKQNALVQKEVAEENNDDEIKELKQYLNKFKDDINNQKQQASFARKEKTVELEDAINKAKKQEEENKCVELSLEIKQEEEEAEVEKMIELETTSREKKELDKKKNKLKSQLDAESKAIIDSQQDLIDAVNKMRDQMKSKLVQTVVSLQKNQDPDMCYFMEYVFPQQLKNNPQKMKFVCESFIEPAYVDLDLVNQCLKPDAFCNVCCNQNIGEANSVEREKCTENCNKQLQGATPSDEFALHFELQSNAQKIKADQKEIDARIAKLQQNQLKIAQQEMADQAKSEKAMKDKQAADLKNQLKKPKVL